MKLKYLIILLLFLCKFSKANDCRSKCENHQNCDCSNLGLTEFPDRVHENIRQLNLSSNKITTLSTINSVDSLEKLDLSYNGLKEMSYDAFDNLDSLKYLMLSHNNIESVGDDIFEWNPLGLKVIHLDNNKLEFIQHFLFYDLDELTEIDLSHNKISFIHPHAFGKQNNLMVLKLNNNNLHTINPSWFAPFDKDTFSYLDMEHNPWSCDCEMASHLDKLKKLDKVTTRFLEHLYCNKTLGKLYHTKIWLTEKDVMKSFCDKPVIKGISEGALAKKGQTLRLKCLLDDTKRPWTSISWRAPNKDTYTFHNADQFDGIVAHPDGSLEIQDFKKIDNGTYECIAKNYQGQIKAKTEIKYSESTSENEEKMIDNPNTQEQEGVIEDAHCPNHCSCTARSVDCARLKLTSIPIAPPITRTFNLEGNEITKVEATKFQQLGDLTELRLDENYIDTIEYGAFDKLVILETLSLRQNLLTSLPNGLFTKLKNLKKLILDDNNIKYLGPDVFQGLQDVAWLYIRNNQLLEIKESSLMGLNSVQFLHLENNNLHYFPVGGLRELTVDRTHSGRINIEIQRIFLTGNQFYCDCRTIDLWKFIHSNSTITDVFGGELKCGFPDTLINRDLLSLSVDDLKCDSGFC